MPEINLCYTIDGKWNPEIPDFIQDLYVFCPVSIQLSHVDSYYHVTGPEPAQCFYRRLSSLINH